MPPSSISRAVRRLLLAASLLPAAALPAQARELTLAVASLQHPHVQASELNLSVSGSGSLHLTAARLDVAELGLAGGLDWHCALQRETDGNTACNGPLRIVAADGSVQSADLGVRIDAQRIELALGHAGSRVSATIPFASAPIRAFLQDVPAAWLKAPLARHWPGGEVRRGAIDVDANLHPDGHVEATYAARDLAFNTRDGAVSGDRLMLTGHVRTRPGAQELALEIDANLHGGQLGAGALQVVLPDAQVETKLAARVRDDGRWIIERFDWRDAGTLELDADGVLEPAALAPLRELHVRIAQLQLPQASSRYARSILAAHDLDGMTLQGSMSGALDVDVDGVQRIALTTPALDIRLPDSDVGFDGVHGGLDWSRHGEQPATALAWKSARIAGFPIGTASSRWQSRNGELHLLGDLRAGLLGGRAKLSQTVLRPFGQADGERVRSAFSFEGIGHDSADGTVAAADVAADGELQFLLHDAVPQLRLQARLRGGEILGGPVYVKLPSAPVALALDLQQVDALWRINTFDWNDPGTLAFSAVGEFAPADARPLRALRIDLREVQLGNALQRYAQSWLATKGYAELSATGALSGRLDLSAQGLRSFAFTLRDVHLRDAAGRFALGAVDGSIDWDVAAARPPTTLGWDTMALFGIPLGPARAALQSQDGRLGLQQPLAVDVLGGQWRLEKLALQPSSPRGERYAGSFSLAGIEMAQLSDALGWPRFGGRLSGGIPEIELVADRIELHGGLDLYLFNGHLGVSGLSLERPFGVAPSLGANIHFQNFDLQQVTEAFSFGGMTGRLNGTVSDLRLVDWQPVAFDAWLRTKGGGRMSYKAVDDLTSIGGGGLSANLQTMALKLFDTFGYRRIGLRCKLRDEVCAMGGIEPIPAPGATDSAGAGYTIVEGSGVPRITIVGHRRLVDWPTLLSRLQEATSGQGPVVE